MSNEATEPRAVGIEYRNHRGEVDWRRIVPERIWYGSTQWHTTNQWMLRAFDLDKNEVRDFALCDITEWSNTP